MCDIVALAFQSDRTRVATLRKEYQAIVKCQVERYAYLVGRLAKTPEGKGTVLDNSCVMCVSEHWNAHSGTRVPLVLAGGPLRTGRTLDYLGAGSAKRKLCPLDLSLMDRMGLEMPAFGDSKVRLSGI
jgi:hypothetical protein